MEREIKKSDDFTRGYMCAVAALLTMHGESGYVDDLFNANGMTIPQMRKKGVDEYDIKVLRPVIKEWSRKKKLLTPTPIKQ